MVWMWLWGSLAQAGEALPVAASTLKAPKTVTFSGPGDKEVTLTNKAEAAVDVLSVEVVQVGQPFSLVEPVAPFALAGGSELAVKVRSDAVLATRATVLVRTSVGVRAVTLRAKDVHPPLEGALTVGSFSQPVGEPRRRTATLTNRRPEPVVLESARVVQSGEVWSLGPVPSQTVEAGQSVDLELRYAPTQPGHHRAAILLRTDAGNVLVNLRSHAEGDAPRRPTKKAPFNAQMAMGSVFRAALESAGCDDKLADIGPRVNGGLEVSLAIADGQLLDVGLTRSSFPPVGFEECHVAALAGITVPPGTPDGLYVSNTSHTSGMANLRLPAGRASLTGHRDLTLVQPTIEQHQSEVDACLAGHSGTTSLEWHIREDGTVAWVTVTDSTFAVSGVEACLAQTVHTWRFPEPPPQGPLTVRWPFGSPK